MTDDLVKKLRLWDEVWPEDMDKPEGHLYEEAADRIEKLEADLALAVEALGEVMRHENSNFFGVNGEASRRASWRGVRRKVAQTLAALRGDKQ